MPDPWALRPPTYRTAPTFEYTDGPQVARLCEKVGLIPDPEQRMMLDVLFALSPSSEQVDADGEAAWLSSAFEVCVVAPRQNMKTGFMKMAALGWLFVTQEKVITWSAHQFDTTKEAFRDLEVILTNTPMLQKRLAAGPSNGIYGGNNDIRIELADGRRIKFKARTNTGSRGLTGDKIILDEAFALKPEHTGSIHPTLTAVPDPQILYGSSAGMVDSEILRDLRDRGRVGSPGLAYFEWCAERRPCADEKCQHFKPSHPQYVPGCALDDPELWRQANTLLGRQRPNGTGLTLEKMRKFREAEDPAEWMRERLGWWDEDGADELFGPGRWAGCVGEVPADRSAGAVGLAVSVDLSMSALVLAARAGEAVLPLPSHHGRGTDWVIDAAVQVAADHRVPVVLDGGGPAAVLVEPLRKAARRKGVRVITANLPNMKDACAAIFRQVVGKQLLHANWPELNDAIAAATKRDVGDRWLWGRRGEGDITPLEAATVALWGQDNVRTRSATDQRLAEGGTAVLAI